MTLRWTFLIPLQKTPNYLFLKINLEYMGMHNTDHLDAEKW